MRESRSGGKGELVLKGRDHQREPEVPSEGMTLQAFPREVLLSPVLKIPAETPHLLQEALPALTKLP